MLLSRASGQVVYGSTGPRRFSLLPSFRPSLFVPRTGSSRTSGHHVESDITSPAACRAGFSNVRPARGDNHHESLFKVTAEEGTAVIPRGVDEKRRDLLRVPDHVCTCGLTGTHSWRPTSSPSPHLLGGAAARAHQQLEDVHGWKPSLARRAKDGSRSSTA